MQKKRKYKYEEISHKTETLWFLTTFLISLQARHCPKSLLCKLECLSRVPKGNGELTHQLLGNLVVPRKILAASAAMDLNTAKLSKEIHIKKC